jgi:hypothetical protein
MSPREQDNMRGWFRGELSRQRGGGGGASQESIPATHTELASLLMRGEPCTVYGLSRKVT